jgi:hypothetical protein
MTEAQPASPDAPPPNLPPLIMVRATALDLVGVTQPDGTTVPILKLTNGIVETALGLQPQTVQELIAKLSAYQGPRLLIAGADQIP